MARCYTSDVACVTWMCARELAHVSHQPSQLIDRFERVSSDVGVSADILIKMQLLCHCAGVTFQPNTLGGPTGVLQFVNANVRITKSSFTGLTGTPYTIIFNNSLVQIDSTNFESNSGESVLAHSDGK